MEDILSAAPGLIYMAGYVPYIMAVVRKEAEPKVVSWLIWGVLNAIMTTSMWSQGTLNWLMLGITVGSWVVLGVTLRYSSLIWTFEDKVYMGVSLVSIVVWQLSGMDWLGLTIALIVTFAVAIPTFKSAWKDPKRENKAGWTLFCISCIWGVLAIPEWTLEHAAQPLVFLSIESTMVLILYLRRPPQLSENDKGD